MVRTWCFVGGRRRIKNSQEIMINLTMMHRLSTGPHEIQNQALENAKMACINTYGPNVQLESTEPIYNETLGWFCPAYWDDILCWPTTRADSLAATQCPSYIVGFDKITNYATRQCMSNGKWFFNEELQKFWTNYSECYEDEQATVWVDLAEDAPQINNSIIEDFMPLLKTIPRVGYTVSLCTLIVAFTIMFTIKKLHCPRNNLHMNLFASFIFRALLSLLKDLLFIRGVGLSSNFRYINGRTFFYDHTESNNWGCKLLTSLWEYFITANYSWILMEGLYLHNLIFRALFTDSSSKITHYIILGWGLPVLIIVPWIIARLLFEDTLCWTTHNDQKKTFLIIRIPTMISIIINTILFVKIAKVLFSKLRSLQSEEAKRYQKWAKSTLVLVPLFGIHYALFLGMSYYIGKNVVGELTWLICDQFFASFQGCFVAILYCFLNGEVQTELKPYMHNIFYCLSKGLCCKCSEDDFKTTKSRSSVCTMMSSTSLYNGANHHRYRTRMDCFNHAKHSTKTEKNMDNMCQSGIRSWQDISPRRTKYPINQYSSKKNRKFASQSNSSILAIDKAMCLECSDRQKRCKSEPHLKMEMMSMLPQE